MLLLTRGIIASTRSAGGGGIDPNVGSFSTAVSFVPDANLGGWQNQTLRNVIKKQIFETTSCNKVRLTFSAASAGEGMTIGACYIQRAVVSETAPDFFSTPVQVFFNDGQAGTTGAAGEVVVSDTVDFDFSGEGDILVSFQVPPSVAANDSFGTKNTIDGWLTYRKTSSQDSSSVVTSGYAKINTSGVGLTKIEFFNPTGLAVWATAVGYTTLGGLKQLAGRNVRVVIDSSALVFASPSEVKVTIRSYTNASVTISKCYVGHAASGGSGYDFSAPPTQITFDGGNDGVTVPVNSDYTSDGASFAYNGVSPLIISYYCPATPVSTARTASPMGWNSYIIPGGETLVDTLAPVESPEFNTSTGVGINHVQFRNTL